MTYKKIKAYDFPEDELRKIWRQEYCEQEIHTFDSVLVKFYEDMFDHVFYESVDRRRGDKSVLSLNRLEKIYWIKDTLQDPEAILKKGWDSKRKEYFSNRRVAIVKGNYVVVIVFVGMLKANFVTAYEKNNISKIIDAPDFIRDEKYFGK